VTHLTRIYIPWWCRGAKSLMTDAARLRFTKGKMQIMGHQ
jgi:hypothetical protein